MIAFGSDGEAAGAAVDAPGAVWEGDDIPPEDGGVDVGADDVWAAAGLTNPAAHAVINRLFIQNSPLREHNTTQRHQGR